MDVTVQREDRSIEGLASLQAGESLKFSAFLTEGNASPTDQEERTIAAQWIDLLERHTRTVHMPVRISSQNALSGTGAATFEVGSPLEMKNENRCR
jgi:hypothetical protein